MPVRQHVFAILSRTMRMPPLRPGVPARTLNETGALAVYNTELS